MNKHELSSRGQKATVGHSLSIRPFTTPSKFIVSAFAFPIPTLFFPCRPNCVILSPLVHICCVIFASIILLPLPSCIHFSLSSLGDRFVLRCRMQGSCCGSRSQRVRNSSRSVVSLSRAISKIARIGPIRLVPSPFHLSFRRNPCPLSRCLLKAAP